MFAIFRRGGQPGYIVTPGEVQRSVVVSQEDVLINRKRNGDGSFGIRTRWHCMEPITEISNNNNTTNYRPGESIHEVSGSGEGKDIYRPGDYRMSVEHKRQHNTLSSRQDATGPWE